MFFVFLFAPYWSRSSILPLTFVDCICFNLLKMIQFLDLSLWRGEKVDLIWSPQIRDQISMSIKKLTGDGPLAIAVRSWPRSGRNWLRSLPDFTALPPLSYSLGHGGWSKAAPRLESDYLATCLLPVASGHPLLPKLSPRGTVNPGRDQNQLLSNCDHYSATITSCLSPDPLFC